MEDVFAWLTGLIGFLLPGFGATELPPYSGYVEGRYVHVAATTAGPIESISGGEGEQVQPQQVLFRLQQNQQQAVLQAAEARMTAAEANLKNLTTGSREDEIDVIRASL